MFFHETSVDKPTLEKDTGSADFYVRSQRARIAVYLLVPVVTAFLGLVVSVFFLLAGGSLVTCLFIGWILGERITAKKYIESVRLTTKLVEAPKKSKEEDRGEVGKTNRQRLSKEKIAELYKLLKEGETVKRTSVRTLGFIAWLELRDWMDNVKKVTGDVCGRDSIEYLLVPTAEQVPRGALDEAVMRTKTPSGSELVGTLLDAVQNPSVLFRGELPGGTFRLSNNLRNIMVETIMDALKTVIMRLEKGYGPLKVQSG